ncbi:MAG: GNAT family protein [Bacteroidia bacterium]
MNLEPIILHTKNFILKGTSAELLTHCFENWTDQELRDFFYLESDDDIAKEKENISKGVSTYKMSSIYFYILDKFDNKLLGDCGFHTWHLKHHRAEIGYALRDENNWGKGYMSEIIPILLKYGFEEMGLHRIEAMVGTSNPASEKLLLKNKFEYEGFSKENYNNKGKFEDSKLYGLLKSNWRQ